MSEVSEHFTFMKIIIDEPLSVLERDYRSTAHDPRTVSQLYHNGYHCKIIQILQENLYIKGDKVIVHRIFIHTPDSGDYESTGWVLPMDIDCCMICYQEFGFLSYKYSCYGCGNVICNKCSSENALIMGFERCGPQRVCNVCYYGQEVSDSAAYMRIL